MDFFSLFIVSFVEGITEFLPISSTGHMIIVSEALSLENTEKLKAFQGMIQFFAILAILLIYRSRVSFSNTSLWLKTLVAFVPVGAIGFLFSDYIKELFTIKTVAYMFIVGGVALLFTEKIYQKTKRKDIQKIDDISYTDALKIGIFQIFALIPGTSRSGSTIFGAMVLGIERKISAEFSFLLAVPVTFAVFAFDFFSFFRVFTKEDFIFLSFSAVVSFVSAYISVRVFLALLEKFSLASFGVYRIIVGLVILLFFI